MPDSRHKPASTPTGIRTRTVLILSELPPADWAIGALVLSEGVEPSSCRYKLQVLTGERREQSTSGGT